MNYKVKDGCMPTVYVSESKLSSFMRSILIKEGVREDVTDDVVEGMLHASRRGVDSHGVSLFPHYLKVVRAGRINKNPSFEFQKTSISTGLLNADHSFGHAAGQKAVQEVVKMSGSCASGHVAVFNSSHFGAASFYAIEMAKHDLIGLSFTHADSFMKTPGSSRPFFGTNPLCVAVPCEGEDPLCLDMSTTVFTYNKVRLFKNMGLELPKDVACDVLGNQTTDPKKVAMLNPIGGYKGFGLAMIVEILCSMLTAMPYGTHISRMYDAPLNEKRYLGQFYMGFRIDCFQPLDIFKTRMSALIQEVRSQPSTSKEVYPQVPGDPEKRCEEERKRTGIPLERALFKEFQKIAAEYGLAFMIGV